MNVFIGQYFRTKDSKIALATVFAFLIGTGMTTKYLVKSHIRVTAYSLPFSDFGSGPKVSLSKAFIGVSVIINGSLIVQCQYDLLVLDPHGI